MKTHVNFFKGNACKKLNRLTFPVAILFAFIAVTGCEEEDENGDNGNGFNQEVNLKEIAADLTSPVMLTESPDNSGRLFVVDQVGVIWIIEDDNLISTPFLDIQDKIIDLNPSYDERGLLGLAFHPDFGANGRFFIHYSSPLRPEAPDNFDHTSIFAEYIVSQENPDAADVNSERIIMAVDQPYSNHNGGSLGFGNDGYLYIALGDGGNRDDEGIGHVEDWYEENAGGNGQDITQNLHGSILRIDVDGDEPYEIPPDNPFVESEALDEIYAYGFRNPYRFSFDMGGGNELYVSDAGQELWEEVSVVNSGGNYGWNVKEGAHCFDAENPEVIPEDCPEQDTLGNALVDPVLEFANSTQGGLGAVVVGGYVYRGDSIEGLNGYYIFGAWSQSIETPSGQILIANTSQLGGDELWDFEMLNLSSGELGEYLLAFGQDNAGEVYALTTDNAGPSGNTGKVYRISP